ncbi:Vacuolar calcium ion transporter [Podospora bellae-mahoneyi]|uniref:Vacuolar calcium ion transporter n=2 Tax=Podospora TaxID=5144 RepID=A0ABY6SAI2_PODCO|nr:Vacuolar calcium ion transporter [Podospora bellae-mahoneyi]VBB79954.1 Putative vacuolar calcium ion transporter [Podospora comata]
MGKGLINYLSSLTVHVQTRQILRRVTTGKAPHETGSPSMDDEESPLLGHRIANGGSEANFWKHLLLDRTSSPGTKSPNALVRLPAHFFNVFKITLLSSWINVLLVFVPFGLIAGTYEWNPTLVFTLNFFAIIPLAAILSFATEEIAARLGETLGGLVNATLGNAVELIVSIVALRANQVEIVQASMLGSILSNLLLVLGMCFFLGGLTNMRDADGNAIEQSFSAGTAQTTCSLMTLASATMILPAALYGVLDSGSDKEEVALLLSRCSSVVLLFLYVMYLIFSLRSHKRLFESEAGPNAGEEEEHDPLLGPWSAGIVLLLTTLVISFCADHMVNSIDAVAESGALNKTFIGLILIPIVGNAAEHVTACVVAVKNKMDLAMGVAIGSSIQISLLVTPSLVLLGWAIGVPMTLRFETFQTVAFAVSVLVVTYTVQDGKSNYLEGAMLLGLYMIIALAFWASG